MKPSDWKEERKEKDEISKMNKAVEIARADTRKKQKIEAASAGEAAKELRS